MGAPGACALGAEKREKAPPRPTLASADPPFALPKHTPQYAYREGHESWATAPPLLPADVDAIIVRCTASPGSPCDATVRLQAAYETAFHRAHGAFEGALSTRTRRLGELVAVMGREAGGAPPGATPAALESLSAVYRALLEYCAVFACLDPAAAGAAPAAGSVGPDGAPLDTATFLAASAREAAAAMDSVFPRSALAGFSALAPEARGAQAQEVALLSLGVRLLAWVRGQGGAGLENTPARALAEARALAADVAAAAKAAMAACDAYVDVLAAAGGAGGAGGVEAVRAALRAAGDPPPAAWPAELANRRVLAALAVGLSGDLEARLAALEAAHAQWAASLAALTELTSGRASVAKEAVYPHFAALAVAFLSAAESRAGVAADRAVWAAVAPSAPPSVCSLPPGVAQAAQAALGWAARTKSPASLHLSPLRGGGGGGGGEGATRTALEDAPPALLNAPIELQGFCPVALAAALPPAALGGGGGGGGEGGRGALVPGDSALGIFAWQGRLYLVSSAAAGAAFAAAPGAYVRAVGALARAHPDLLHALQLVGRRDAPAGHCPEANLQLLSRFDGDLGAAAGAAAAEEAAGAANGGGGAPAAALAGAGAPAPAPALPPGARLSRTGALVADAGTATPTHFVDRRVEPRYHFSQWALRRAALQMARLRGCATTSAQTDGSHFRRDNDAQAAPAASAGTQTMRAVGVATDKERPQLLQVRGAAEPVVQAAAERKARGLPAMPI